MKSRRRDRFFRRSSFVFLAKEIKQRACLVFPFLWTLDLLSQRFNFWPLPCMGFFSCGPCASPSVSVPPMSSGVLPNVFTARKRQCVVLVMGQGMYNATAIRSRALVSRIYLPPSFPPWGFASSFFISFSFFSLISLFLFLGFFFFFFLFFSFRVPWNTLLNGTDRGQIRTILFFFRFAAGVGDFTSQFRDKRLWRLRRRLRGRYERIDDEKYFEIDESFDHLLLDLSETRKSSQKKKKNYRIFFLILYGFSIIMARRYRIKLYWRK